MNAKRLTSPIHRDWTPHFEYTASILLRIMMLCLDALSISVPKQIASSVTLTTDGDISAYLQTSESDHMESRGRADLFRLSDKHCASKRNCTLISSDPSLYRASSPLLKDPLEHLVQIQSQIAILLSRLFTLSIVSGYAYNASIQSKVSFEYGQAQA